ncbi:TIGR03621 family F420-dependent LLM class oxidoreductase [Streptomyces albus]|uniref:TIGR03621 family F420-dependent LLM class oxidoreductase n=1 Tax=Streptomyces albus TaxID=1888 RepID=UPI003409C422
MKPFVFSLVASDTTTGRDWLELARRAEGDGYHALYCNDHLHQSLTPFAALAAAAAVTSTVRLGPRVANAGLRHPVGLAHEAATLDLLSEGRAELGVGAGWLARDHHTSGARFPDGATRLAAFTEALDILEPLLRGEKVTWRGEHYTAEVDTPFTTVTKPRIPLCVGAGGPRMLALAAQRADVVSITGRALPGGGIDVDDLGPERLDEKIAVIREAAGERMAEVELHHVVWECLVTPRPEAVTAAYAAGMGVTEDRLRQLPGLLIGTAGQVAEQLLERRERWGISQVSVPYSCAAAFAPVVARLAGR